MGKQKWLAVGTLMAALVCTSATPATIVRFSQGADGETNISTPWGDYTAVQQGDSVWVGTPAEFEHNRVAGIMRDHGSKEFNISGKGKRNNFIDATLPVTSVGNTAIASISISVLFGEKPNKRLGRAAKPAGTEYVSVLWLQDSATKISAALYDADAAVSYAPYKCIVESDLHVCEFQLPTQALSHKASIGFLARNQKPGLMSVESISMAQYTEYLGKRKSSPGEASSHEDRDALRQLHAVDDRVPARDPTDPVHYNLKLEICNAGLKQFGGPGQEISYPISLRIRGASYSFYPNRTIYNIYAAPVSIKSKPTCYAGLAKLAKNPTLEEPPAMGATLDVDYGISTDDVTGQQHQIQFSATVTDVLQMD
ncbi:MAG: hypothetical protein JWP38_3710 [Herbaspirillum sp.]|nr:hypothetical protein [Herbaspirillum sp.]